MKRPKPPGVKDEVVNVRMTSELYKMLQDKAWANGKRVGEFVRGLIEESVKVTS